MKLYDTCEKGEKDVVTRLLKDQIDLKKICLIIKRIKLYKPSMSLEQVYLRGSQIRFVVIPDVFKYAPMFKKIRANAQSKNMQQIREKARQMREELVPRIKQGLEQQKK